MIFSVQGTSAVAARTALTIVSTATVRPRICELILGQVGVVALDSNFQFRCQRFTVAGTTTAVTPGSTDSADPAATFTAGSNATVEPTYTANTILRENGVNPRNTWRWAAYSEAAEWILPPTAANGVGVFIVVLGGATTVVADVSVKQ